MGVCVCVHVRVCVCLYGHCLRACRAAFGFVARPAALRQWTHLGRSAGVIVGSRCSTKFVISQIFVQYFQNQAIPQLEIQIPSYCMFDCLETHSCTVQYLDIHHIQLDLRVSDWGIRLEPVYNQSLSEFEARQVRESRCQSTTWYETCRYNYSNDFETSLCLKFWRLVAGLVRGFVLVGFGMSSTSGAVRMQMHMQMHMHTQYSTVHILTHAHTVHCEYSTVLYSAVRQRRRRTHTVQYSTVLYRTQHT